MTSFAVSRATVLDAEIFAELHGQCFANSWDATAMRSLLDSPGVTGVLGATSSHIAPQGFALGRIAADEAEILSIGVAPDIQGRGLGARLLSALLADIRLGGASSVFLEVAAGNFAAQALYARTGFRHVGLRKGYYDMPAQQPEDAAILRLDFAAS